ncbi:C40 family peptidase [Pedobacter namyangjuensis]|uniref:hypothetical protein n=1 Tax=Pedobacter namyangjuensis TaxID=600626 RepID=UPI001F06D6BF|nr:hypothetical protein [Pedobacter namyangjuensis]
MATIRILLGIICLTFADGFVKPGSDFLERFRVEGLGLKVDEQRFWDEGWEVGKLKSWNVSKRTTKAEEGLGFKFKHVKLSNSILTSKRTTKDGKRLAKDEQRIAKQVIDYRQQIIAIAKSQVGIREATANNDGVDVEKYLAYTGNQKGDPWCASFVSWVFGKAGYHQPKSAWSPDLFPKKRQAQEPTIAMVFGIYYPKLKRIAHCGLVSKLNGNWVYTIEGNTNVSGSREGDGVYQRIRHKRIIKVYADWLKENGGSR